MSVSIRGRLFHLLVPFVPIELRDKEGVKNPSRSDKANEIPKAVRRALSCKSTDLGGYALHTLTPKEINEDALHIVYFHGGGYVGQAAEPHWVFLQKLAQAINARVTYVQYPLAPESVHTETIAHAIKATEYVRSEYANDRLVVMGDSAGGGISLALVRNLIERGKAQPFEKVALVSPWVDPTSLDLVSPELAKKDLILVPENLKIAAQLYAGQDSVSHPNVAPMQGSFAGFPPVGIWMGTRDIFYRDMPAFLEKLKENDVDTTYHVGEGMLHDYPLFPIPEGAQAIAQIKAFLMQ